jgi:hypothetical protein
MMTPFRTRVLRIVAPLLLPGSSLVAQNNGAPAAPRPSDDSVVVQASTRYGASGIHRFLLGNTYRDLWAKPIKVPVLDLATYAGGLTPLEEGGNAQTRNLHLRGADGREYVFRPIFKEVLQLPDELKGTVIEDIFADGLSASHPAATVIPTPFLRAAKVLHAAPTLYVMPDDRRLGEFRDFAGKLGTMEQFPEDPDEGGFAGAVDVIDSEDLLEDLNEDPSTRVDAHALLRARLVDMLIGDNDRHPGQWKWARMRESSDARWIPIPRDRDKAFVSYEGALLAVGRMVLPRLVTYGNRHSSALFRTATEFDRRLLISLDRADFDSTARVLQRTITDSVITAAVATMPREYRQVNRELVARLRARRDDLPRAAAMYYRALFENTDLHGTDAPERATITRNTDGTLEVELSSGGRPYFERTFRPSDTRGLRLYLHAGDDTVTLRGRGVSGIPVWLVGGTGRNVLDAPDGPVAGARFYEFNGSTARPADKEQVEESGYDPDTAWNRRPIVMAFGEPVPPFRDHGISTRHGLGLSMGRGLGVVPSVEFRRTSYGFRQYPYASRVELELAYATAVAGWKGELTTDNRFESSSMFLKTETGMSQLLTGRFAGFGNANQVPEDATADVHQTQWRFRPSVGFALTPTSELTLGPVVKYTITDSVPGTYVAAQRPFGFRRFGQAGLSASLHHETEETFQGSLTQEFMRGDPERGLTLDADAAWYPAVWDSPGFATLAAVATAHITIPVLSRPVLAARAGGQRNFGQFPYFEGAFLGGGSSLRTAHRHQYAGDAVLHGSVELRVPVAQFALVLPLNTGILGFVDAGRVYHDGASPGGWHSGAGAGIWIGVLNPSRSLTVSWTNDRNRRVIIGTGFVY